MPQIKKKINHIAWQYYNLNILKNQRPLKNEIFKRIYYFWTIQINKYTKQNKTKQT